MITYHDILGNGIVHTANVLSRHEMVQVLCQRFELLVAFLLRLFSQHLHDHHPRQPCQLSHNTATRHPYLGLFHEIALHALQYQSTLFFDHAAVLLSASMVLLVFPAIVAAETTLQLNNHVMKK